MEGCKYLEQKEINYLYDNPFGVHELKQDGLFCTKKQHYVHPFWCKSPISQEDIIDEIENELMPKECSLRKIKL